jgi:CRISPR-associated endonuclease Csn1
MPMPWPRFREQVDLSIRALLVSHRPDHNHEGRLHNETAYGLRDDGMVAHRVIEDGRRVVKLEKLAVIPIASPSATHRHGVLPDGSPRPYKGYKGDSNHCIEVVRGHDGRWEGEVVSTFEANRIARQEGAERLRDARLSASGRPLVMRLFINDLLQLKEDGTKRLFRVATIRSNGQISLAEHFESNVDARQRDRTSGFSYLSKSAGSLQKSGARAVNVSPIGMLSPRGFR